ncbi:MAG: winged helix-turn-helix transcriptional regulator [Massilioclostridium sp.]|nr:winged helix-turn-helix transcriptional regulator [Massilioclostridium sp.]MEE1492299.1 winged helix-turn-helix transcriptional regulator [Massilioclostridium sp.]
MSTQKMSIVVTKERTGSGRSHIIMSDANTGEVVHDYWETQHSNAPFKEPSNSQCNFIKLYRTNLTDIVKKKKLDLNEAGLFMLILSMSGWQTPYIQDPETKRNASLSDIARFTGYSRSHISVIMERLCKKGIIAKVNRGEGKACHFMINTNISFFGKTIDDIRHTDTFTDCAYEQAVTVKYRKTPEKNK